MTRPTNPGIFYGIAAYGIWGILPIYLKWLQPLPGPDILAHRILWSLLLLAGLAIALRHGPALASIVRRPRVLGALAVSAILIGVNWLVYILAVNGGHVADASLGYFINPLVNVVLGVVVLRERLGRAELAAVLIALAGVVWLTVTQGRLPVTALVLAGSFGLYGLVRKLTPVEAIDGLLVETTLLAPASLAWLLLAGTPGGPSPLPGWPLTIGAGVVTAVPLLLFAAAAKRVRLADLGLLQYLAPSLQLALAVFLYGEPLPATRLVGFVMIWLALVVYATAAVRRGRQTAEAD
jgi:chloramphenicol-sensitive protein RarD